MIEKEIHIKCEKFVQWMTDKVFETNGLFYDYWKEAGQEHWMEWLKKNYQRML